jgi:hypothetical protein
MTRSPLVAEQLLRDAHRNKKMGADEMKQESNDFNR